jgi:hypothetical protein
MRLLFRSCSVLFTSFILLACGGGESDSGSATPPVVSYIANASAAPGGSIYPISRSVSPGQTITFTITSDVGYKIQSVSGCNGNLSGNSYTTGAINANCSVIAAFTLNSYEIKASASTGGSITPAQQVVDHGQTINFTLSAAESYEIGEVTGCNGILDGSNYITGAITSACQVNAEFTTREIAAQLPGYDQPIEISIIGQPNVAFLPESKGLIPISGDPNSPSSNPPEGLTLPYALFDFVAKLEQPGGSMVMEFSYPEPLPEQTGYWKYGRASAQSNDSSWFMLPTSMYSISDDRKTLRLTLQDGEIGDDDWTVNGIIRDPGGPGALAQYTVNVVTSAGGISDPQQINVTHGESVAVNLRPDSGYSIEKVSGCGGTLSFTCQPVNRPAFQLF